MSPESRRYFVALSEVLPQEARDTRRSLRHADGTRDLRPADVGSPGVLSIPLEEDELERVEGASNVRYVEAIGDPLPTNVDTLVPADIDLISHKADMLYEWGFTGSGIDVGVLDDGLPSGLRSKFNIKAMRKEPSAGVAVSNYFHGGAVASIATPRQSQLAFSDAGTGAGSVDAEAIVSGLYWLTDTVGVHIINISSGGVGFGPYETHQEAISNARANNVIVVCSAGNDSSSAASYPSAYDGTISVGGLDRTAGWSRWSGSNYGSYVDIWANAVGVQAYDASGTVVSLVGTSFAAPLVTYVKAALLTKGLTSIGDAGVSGSVADGADSVDNGGDDGDDKRLNGSGAAYQMPNYCP